MEPRWVLEMASVQETHHHSWKHALRSRSKYPLQPPGLGRSRDNAADAAPETLARKAGWVKWKPNEKRKDSLGAKNANRRVKIHPGSGRELPSLHRKWHLQCNVLLPPHSTGDSTHHCQRGGVPMGLGGNQAPLKGPGPGVHVASSLYWNQKWDHGS